LTCFQKKQRIKVYKRFELITKAKRLYSMDTELIE